MKKLTSKQKEIWFDEYFATGDAIKAAKKAGIPDIPSGKARPKKSYKKTKF